MDKKYKVARQHLLDIILSSPNNTKIPSERDLIDQLGFSRPTIQKAIETLKNEGYLYKRDRQGTFTIERTLHRQITNLLGFTQEATDLGFEPHTILVAYEKLQVPSDIAAKMQIPEKSIVHFCKRLRKRDNLIIMLDHSYFADFALPDVSIDNFQGSIYEYVEHHTNRKKIGRAHV